MKKQKFTKHDLKVGYIVRDSHDLYMVMVTSSDEQIMVDKNGGWMPLDKYDTNLNHNSDIGSSAYSITEVYGYSNSRTKSCDISTYGRTLLWKREDPAKKMTVEEIEKELGYKIEIVS